MKMTNAEGKKLRKQWLVWVLLSLLLSAWLAYLMLSGDNKELFMPGPVSSGHHQIGVACEACHTDPLGGGEVILQACIDCHGEDRKKPDDSHPVEKFLDPRNADRLENIDATNCITCHTEHRPEITMKDGLTQAIDLCFHCHADVAENRPSHKGMEFTSCKDSGCHNYHNNRALYTEFLLKHQGEEDLLENRLLPKRALFEALEEIMEYPHERYPLQALAYDDMDAPKTLNTTPKIYADWMASAHAGSGVNCSACHSLQENNDSTVVWSDEAGDERCTACHSVEQERFEKGKHGMRLAVGLTAMTPSMARLPMKEEAGHVSLGCNSCHSAHAYDSGEASVEACLACHDDEHSRNYRNSAHYSLWEQEQQGSLPKGSGVSCASCHMPRVDFDVSEWVSRTMVDHNQSANLSPNSKMLRSSCLHCHGLQFSLDSLADVDLITRNFTGKPSIHVKSIGLAIEDQRRAEQERAQAQE